MAYVPTPPPPPPPFGARSSIIRVFERAIADPLSLSTRVERRNLMLTSVIATIVVATGLIPTKISALGIDFSTADRRTLLYILCAVVVYFLAAFITGASADVARWAVDVDLAASGEEPTERSNVSKARNDIHEFVAMIVVMCRVWFDFILPLVVGSSAAFVSFIGYIPYQNEIMHAVNDAAKQIVRELGLPPG